MMATATIQHHQTLKPKDLSQIPLPVGRLVCDLVNNYGVGYRIQDGRHLLLYSGERGVPPKKVSAGTKEEHSLRFIGRWAAEHVPGWAERHQEPPAAPEAASEAPEEPQQALSAPESPETGWQPYRYGFETDGTEYRCTVEGCGYHKADNHGLHLHQARKHGTVEQKDEVSRLAAKSRRERTAQRNADMLAGLHATASFLGVKVVESDADVREVTRLRKENERLAAQVAALTAERDDLKAKIKLAKEAFSL